MDDDDIFIGKRSKGRVLVCHGDDYPSEFADWLEPLVSKFQWLASLAEEQGVSLETKDDPTPIHGVIDFCERLGVEFSSNFWEGSLISGVYQIGWIQAGTVRAAKKQGRQLLQALEHHVSGEIRRCVMKELDGIKDLEAFIERTADDRGEIREQINHLKSSLHQAHQALDQTSKKLSLAEQQITSAIDAECVRLAVALITGERCRVVAGPLVLWDDGVVYAITSWGGTPIPIGSAPAILLDGLQRSTHRVVKIRDATVIGGLFSGPVYRKGPSDINGWRDVWSEREKNPRSFEVKPKEYADTVRQIHEELAAARSSKAPASDVRQEPSAESEGDDADG